MNARTTAQLLLGAALLLGSGSAFAQDRDTDPNVVYEDETEFNFEDDFVEGARIAPLGELVPGQRHGRQSRLMNLRSDFVSEIVESWEQR